MQLNKESTQLRLSGFGDAQLETEFANWLRAEATRTRRWLVFVPFLAMVLAPLYGGLLFATPPTNVFWLRLIEFGVAAPACALSLILLFLRPNERGTTTWMLIAGIVVFWSVAAIRWLGASPGATLSPEIVMVVPLAFAAAARLRLFLILPMTLGCASLFLVAEWLINGGSHYGSTVLGTVLFVGLSLITAIATDRLARRAWLAKEIVELTAMSDALSGLPNRQWLNRDLAVLFSLARRNRQRLAVFLIDLDHFKRLNDTHGHAAGDAALTAVGALLAGFGRRSTDLAGRYGGEEFVLVLHDAKLYGAIRMAEALVQGIAELKVQNDGAALGYLTASIGLYVAAPDAHSRPEDFLHEADIALYAAKRAGRNRYLLRQPEDNLGAAQGSSDALATELPLPPT